MPLGLAMPRAQHPQMSLEGEETSLAPGDAWSSVESMASLGRLVAGVAHEINNPLAYLLGSVELLERALLDIAAAESAAGTAARSLTVAQAAVANAKDGVERIRAIVRDLSVFSRAGPQGRHVVDVEALLDSAIDVAWNELRHRVRIIKSFCGVGRVVGDEGRLAQVFLNLLLNASRAIPEERRGVLRISTGVEGDRVVVGIEDDGIEIGSEELPYVFEPFRRSRAGASGAGLGLALCRNVVTALGGTITVMSGPEVGNRFTVTLQAARASEASAEGNRARGRDRVTNRARILIIDDEPLLGQTLRFAFQEKHDVEVVASGREALERLTRDTDFDLVLCDLMMPDVSGEHVYRAVAERTPLLVPRFVFMTGGAFTERAQEFLAHFAGKQLEKPFNIDEVEALLTELSAGSA
jgi:two-component system cell cycle sensor histidine kinase/response regulator CckA